MRSDELHLDASSGAAVRVKLVMAEAAVTELSRTLARRDMCPDTQKMSTDAAEKQMKEKSSVRPRGKETETRD